MEKLYMIVMIVCASLMLIISIIMLVRKGKPFKYKDGLCEEEKEKQRKISLNMFIVVFIQSIAIYISAAANYFSLWYLYLIAALLSIPTVIWAIKTLINKTSNNPK